MEPPKRSLPDDPVAFVRACVHGHRILWTYHVNLRFAGRSVPREMILEAIDSCEIVEAYPEDKYLPSYLMLLRPAGDAVHVLFATDVDGDNVRVVTAYRPSPDEWADNLKTRRTER